MVERGPVLAALRERLSRRAESHGWAVALPFDIAVDAPGPMRIVVPPSVTRARLVSSSGHGYGDACRLGALLGDIRLDKAPVVAPACYASGFHALEDHDGAHRRWTDGEAILAIDGVP